MVTDIDRLETLTPYELHVLKAIALGYSESGVAQFLGRSIHTTHNHTRIIYEKLGLTHSADPITPRVVAARMYIERYGL